MMAIHSTYVIKVQLVKIKWKEWTKGTYIDVPYIDQYVSYIDAQWLLGKT